MALQDAVKPRRVGSRRGAYEKPTAARLLFSAANSYVASVEVARHGYPLQHGSIARMLVETLATVLILATQKETLEQFHQGKLSSSKCVGRAKDVLPPIAPLWGFLSNEFVHIGQRHAELALPKKYSSNDQEIPFLRTSVLSSVWLLYVVAELVFFHQCQKPKFWRAHNGGFTFDPTDEGKNLMNFFLEVDV